jgi:peroxiredoxin
MHGEAFNEGPRQAAYLMRGTGKVHLAVTTKSPEAQAFFDQGVGQLHGFWYFEAERSFRQVAALDPDCAMAYWGMAMANVNNPKRAGSFIRKAVERRAKASSREQRWIDAYAAYWREKDGQDRRRLVRALEDLSYEFPGELEAKAFLVFQLWDNTHQGIPLASEQAVDALLSEIFTAEPMHPAHHYRIHLWDASKAVRALGSAARSGQSSPNIAHQWHMSGHTFAKLHRYTDAAWQQEASARVDHRYMMRDHVLPDQIHNYTHNNQWLVEDLEYVGRAHDAVALACNLIELPRHPRYNTFGIKPDGSPYEHNHGSSGEGRRRLLETLHRFELWDDLIRLAGTPILQPTDIPSEQVKRLRALGTAFFQKGETSKGCEQIHALEAMRDTLRGERAAAADRAEADARRRKDSADKVSQAMVAALSKYADRLQAIEEALAELHGHEFLARGDKTKAAATFAEAGELPKERRARLCLLAGETARAEQFAREAVDEDAHQVCRLANYADILQTIGKTAEAREQMKRLQPLSAETDLDLPVMKRLAGLAQALGWPADWRVPKTVAPDVGQRPALDSLGPLHWQPTPAAAWSLPDGRGRQVSLQDYHGRPVIVIFFLGHGCPHCIEQLKAFEPLLGSFTSAGISLVAISTDSADGLARTVASTKWPTEFPLISNPDLRAFRAYRAFDDFEKKPLHGTFLIDADGLVRWQDIGYEPFTDVKFLLAEAKRLLGLRPGADLSRANASAGTPSERSNPAPLRVSPTRR